MTGRVRQFGDVLQTVEGLEELDESHRARVVVFVDVYVEVTTYDEGTSVRVE